MTKKELRHSLPPKRDNSPIKGEEVFSTFYEFVVNDSLARIDGNWVIKIEQETPISTVQEIMMEFANLTGLFPAGQKPILYLWTDAFAVCNFLALYQQMKNERYKELALHLVDQVHNILGRHREDDRRTGWISGLDEEEGRMHPTGGGLRIGKGMNERGPRDPYDERLEWDREGQYYHYLTKWMHALNRVSRVTGETIYNRWAIELAKTAHARFTYSSSSGKKCMY
jgi:hypothetical protein